MTQLRDYGRQIESDPMLGSTPPLKADVASRSPRTGWAGGFAWAVAAFVLILGMGALYFAFSGGDGQVVDQTTVPTPTTPASPFLDTWVTLDGDGSTPTMTIRGADDGAVEMLVHDDYASVCSGAPSTMTGTGRLEGTTTMIVPSPVLTCDDGSGPEALSGPPLEEQLRDLTFVHDPESDTLTDNLGSYWNREGAEDPSPEPTIEDPSPDPTVSTDMWPQTNLEEVREAQELADAGDPNYTWQLDAALAANGEPWGAEIFARFMEEELGWEEFSVGNPGFATGDGGGLYEEVVFIRCAPGETNPLNSLYADAPPEIRGCAPTIDELSYETVRFRVTQPGRRGSSGIWVVDEWEMNKPADQGSLWGLLYPDFSFSQVEQVVPPSDAEVSAFLEEFLQTRVAGEGAEQYLLREPEGSPFEDTEVPLLYATTSGTPYERSEIQRLQGPVWPNGWMEYKVRLFAEGETVVEQYFHVVPQGNGQFGLIYGYTPNPLPTTENGQSVAVPYSFLDGQVTFAAAPPWRYSGLARDDDATVMSFSGSARGEGFVIAADPLLDGTSCENVSAPSDAEALARSIMADPNFETTGTVPVSFAGIDGLQMDVDAAVADWNDFCWPWVPDQSNRWRMRLYLVDYPGESAGVLTIAVIAAPETDFERVLEEAAPIVESLEVHTD
jgi:hypothetical protein